MNKILNYIIGILSFFVLIMLFIIVYRLITFEKYTVSLTLNGADSVESNTITCKLSLRGCVVKLPSAKRNNGTILGYSDDINDTQAKYQQEEEILIKQDMNLYAISYKDIVVTIDQNGVDYLENNKVTCQVYNENTSCKIKLPNFNKIGYQLAGYSTNREISKEMNSYFQNEEYEFSNDMTLYPNYTVHTVTVSTMSYYPYINSQTYTKEVTYNMKDPYSINNTFVEFETTVSQDVIDTYKKIADDINKNMPYLYTGTKLNILSNQTFLSIWGGNGNTLGVNYNSASAEYPLSRSLDILSSYGSNWMDKYWVVVHEMGHSFDFYYGYELNKPKTITNEYSPIDGTKSISAQSDIKQLFTQYSRSNGQRPLRDYAYTSVQEFVAEAIAYYYLKFIVPTDKFSSSYYPDDLKTTMEKYFCIAKNNYDASKC